MIREKKLLGVRVFYDTKLAIIGLTELPAHFVAVSGHRILVVGEPGHDTVQLAMSEVGLQRADVSRYPMGQGSAGLLVDLAA